MRTLNIVALSAFAAFTALSVRADDVVTLTDATFGDFIKSHDHVLAEFYAPWCGHCKSLAPEYEAAAAKLKTLHPEVKLAKIDATAETKIAEEFEIQGFPTLKWIVKGSPKEYQGGRTEPAIVSWISKKLGPAAKSISAPAEVDALKAENDVVVIGLFNDQASAAGFLSAAQDAEEIPYAIAVGDAAISALKSAVGCSSGAPFIVLYKKFDEGVAIFSGDASDASQVSKFVNGNSLPLVVPFNSETSQKIFGGSAKQHILFFVDETVSGQKDSIVAAVTPSAKENVGNYLFVTVDKTEARILDFFGIKEQDIPTARIVELGENLRKFRFTAKEITEDSVKAFVKAHTAGELSLDLKSEDVPASQDGDVFVLVAKQYDEIIKAPTHKNVLLEIYAPWCGHCKSLAPIYEELAKKYKSADNLIIAKMDGTANEVEGLDISGFPTLKFFPAGSNDIVDYEGGRELDPMSKFLEEKISGLSAK